MPTKIIILPCNRYEFLTKNFPPRNYIQALENGGGYRIRLCILEREPIMVINADAIVSLAFGDNNA